MYVGSIPAQNRCSPQRRGCCPPGAPAMAQTPAVGAAQGLVVEAGVALPAQRPAGVPVQAGAARSPWL